MATTSELIAKLDEFFVGADFNTFTNPVCAALCRLQAQAKLDAYGEVMDDLAWRASLDPAARAEFARASMLEKALGSSRGKETVAEINGYRGSIRKRLLKRIHTSTSGGLWLNPKPSGITEWLGSEAGGRNAIVQALESDPNPEVRALILLVLRDTALPASWFEAIQERRLFEKLDVQTREADWNQAERLTVSSLSSQAQGRILTDAANLTLGKFGALPAFPTGNLQLVHTPPPPPKRWWRSGWLWMAGGWSLALGAVVAGSRRG